MKKDFRKALKNIFKLIVPFPVPIQPTKLG